MVGGGGSVMIASMWASMATWFTPTVLFCAVNLMIGTIFIASKNNNKHHDHDHDHVHGDSFSRIARVSSLLERARSVKVPFYTTTKFAAAAVTAEAQHRYPSQSKPTDCSSSSPLAQSIHSHSTYGTPTSRSESERGSLSLPALAPSLLERVKSINFSSFYGDKTFPAESGVLENSAGQLVQAPSLLDRVKSFKISSPIKSGARSRQPENIDADPHNNPDHHVIRGKSDKTGVPPVKKLSVEMKKSRSEIRIPSDDEEDVDSRRPATARERRNTAFGGPADEGVDAKADDFISRFKQQLKLQRFDSLVRFKEMLNRGT